MGRVLFFGGKGLSYVEMVDDVLDHVTWIGVEVATNVVYWSIVHEATPSLTKKNEMVNDDDSFDFSSIFHFFLLISL